MEPRCEVPLETSEGSVGMFFLPSLGSTVSALFTIWWNTSGKKTVLQYLILPCFWNIIIMIFVSFKCDYSSSKAFPVYA